jgi:hypothetical protein
MADRLDEFFRNQREHDEMVRQWYREKEQEEEYWALLRSLGLQGRAIVKDGNGKVIFDGFSVSPAEEARRETERQQLIADAKRQVLAELLLTGRVTQLDKPPKGSKGEAWIKFYHACKAAGVKYTLVQAASDSGFSYQYIKELHEGCDCNKRGTKKRGAKKRK